MDILNNEYDNCDNYFEDLETDCRAILLRLNIIEDETMPILNQVFDELHRALDINNEKLYELIDKKKDLLTLLNENNIVSLDALLTSLRDVKLQIQEVQENITYCNNKLKECQEYIEG